MNMQQAPSAQGTITPALIGLMAFACGAVAANLYYAQPLIGLIGPDIGLPPRAASLVVTLTQIGYCLGLILLVPLGDLVENRALVGITLSATTIALVCALLAPSALWFLLAITIVGISSAAVQMLVPIAAHMAPAATRGRVVGTVMGGLMVGILLARPIAGLVADAFGWRAVFGLSAVLMVGLLAALMNRLPKRAPAAGVGYGAFLVSMVTLLAKTPLLRRRAAYQAFLFAAFSLFWTAVPLELAGPRFHLSQSGIAIFALVGAAGALAAPIAGRVADRGWSRPATGMTMVLVALAWVLAFVGGRGGLGTFGSVVALGLSGVFIDFGVQSNTVIGQRGLFALGEASRSRLNGLYIAIFFLGGALGSAIASLAYDTGGWDRVTLIGLAFPLIALALYATEFLRGPRPV